MNLSFSDKQLIESVFGMNSGYVLDFSNRGFEEFMMDVVQYSIYTKYPGLSKAKMIRKFFKDETETYVGKTIIMLINYMNDNGLMKADIKERADRLYTLGEKLLGRSNTQTKPKQQNPEPENKSEVNFDSLNASLLAIEHISSPQAKGYAFEKYLNNLFKAFGLDPHASYRTEYDQIDGSFVLDGNTILIEAKYRTNVIPKDDLILFSKKIELKSHFPKGLFITYSLVDSKAIEYFTDRSARFVVLSVEELFIMCQNKYPLSKVLQGKFRTLDEQGIIYKHIMEIM
jgi:hypothetical protein